MYIFEARHLSKTFDRHKNSLVYAVNDVSFNIKKGESLGLVGESGCGKSTLGKLLLKLEQPTSGKLVFAGMDITAYGFEKMRKIRNRMQMIFQDTAEAFNPYFTVRQILREPLLNYGLQDGDINQRIIRMLEHVGLDSSYLNRHSHEISGGQRQRIGIARALIIRPEFVVCDEAVSSIDYALKAKILQLLVRCKEEYGLTYLFISHDIATVNKICDRTLVMYLGNILEEVKDLRGQACHPYTKDLLAATLVADPLRRSEVHMLFREENLDMPQQGCVFQNRCLSVDDICFKDVPKLCKIHEGHYAACHFVHST